MIEVARPENDVPMKQPPVGDAVGAHSEPLRHGRRVTDGLIDETIRVWEPRYRRKIGPEEAAQILTRVVEFFRVLAEHSQHLDAGGEAARTDHVTTDPKRSRLSCEAGTNESSANSKF
jgi:hypothetical protein